MADAAELAQSGLANIEAAILRLLEQHASGLRNSDIAERLGLHSDFRGRQKDYLTYSVLGGLIRKGKIKRDEKTKRFHLAHA
jgi:DNA-binding IclR family transcriptional regulator